MRAGRDLTRLENKIEALRANSPAAPPRGMVLNDSPTSVEPVVFIRGNPGRPGKRVARRFLQALGRHASKTVFERQRSARVGRGDRQPAESAHRAGHRQSSLDAPFRRRTSSARPAILESAAPDLRTLSCSIISPRTSCRRAGHSRSCIGRSYCRPSISRRACCGPIRKRRIRKTSCSGERIPVASSSSRCATRGWPSPAIWI